MKKILLLTAIVSTTVIACTETIKKEVTTIDYSLEFAKAALWTPKPFNTVNSMNYVDVIKQNKFTL